MVVRRVRWTPDANLVGIVLGHDGLNDRSWLVMWTLENQAVRFQWHLGDALLVVNESNLYSVRERCDLAG